MNTPLTVSVLVTMDVEPVKQEANWTGPEDVATSERLTLAYRELAGSHGFPVSFFIHPEAAELHAELFRDFAADGDCLGLHLHPTRFEYPRYSFEFGYYSAAEQREMLIRARANWAATLGQAPLYFRPGAFSANDATFQVLADLGFRGGSLSIPGRIWPQRYCIWAGAELDPHRAGESFRQVAGESAFANVPLSVDTSSPVTTNGMFCFRDLRPNARLASAEETLRNILAGIAERRPAVPVLHLVTHNDQPFDDPASKSSQHLTTVLKLVGPLCSELGMVAEASTISEVCDRVLALPPRPLLQWQQSNEVEM
jgi:hypothetical protein